MSEVFETTVYLECIEDEVEVEVHYEYSPGCKGARENGRQIEPDDPEEAEITGIYHEKEEISDRCDDAAIESLQEEALQDMRSKIESAKEDAEIARYEARMEDTVWL